MRVPENLKLNKFVYIRIPKLATEFAKHGFMAALPNNYTGDEKAPTSGRKSDNVANAMNYAEKRAKEEQKKD